MICLIPSYQVLLSLHISAMPKPLSFGFGALSSNCWQGWKGKQSKGKDQAHVEGHKTSFVKTKVMTTTGRKLASQQAWDSFRYTFHCLHPQVCGLFFSCWGGWVSPHAGHLWKKVCLFCFVLQTAYIIGQNMPESILDRVQRILGPEHLLYRSSMF